MVDVRHVTDYFLSYGYKPPRAQADLERVKGVRINCLGDVKMHKRPQFEAIELRTTDVIFTTHDTSDTADLVEISILTRHCPPDPRWVNSKDAMFEYMNPASNQYATSLHHCYDPSVKYVPGTTSLGFGWPPAQWRNEVKSAIAVRKDMKPLLPIHMEALTKHCDDEVRPLLDHSYSAYHPEEPIKKSHLLNIICRPMFFLYWRKFMNEREDYTTPGPYDNDGL